MDGMCCPYACNVSQVTQQKFDYEERDGVQVETFRETVFSEKKAYVQCEKERCGAWRDGECHYKEYC